MNDTKHILSLSYGKDSIACLEAIKLLGWPLDEIVHAEIWATDTIPADLPPMVEFKKKADKIIKGRYGIEVKHISAMSEDSMGCGVKTYESVFYRIIKSGKHANQIYGFPMNRGSWCVSKLKTDAIHRSKFEFSGVIEQYIGIAADEPIRIKRHEVPGIKLPLVEVGWDEAYCRKWCEDNDLLSPIYTTATRGGCWFCHNQSVQQLRLLRRNYPELWGLMLKWDKDSPVSFHADGRTVHDFDRRFEAEDRGAVPTDNTFRWRMVDEEQLKWF